jgi:hypothetical protein
MSAAVSTVTLYPLQALDEPGSPGWGSETAAVEIDERAFDIDDVDVFRCTSGRVGETGVAPCNLPLQVPI